MNRLDKAANYRRQTKQSFVAEVVMAEVTAIEESRRIKKPAFDDEAANRFGANAEYSRNGIGLGLAARRSRSQVNAQEQPAAPQTAPVVVNVGNVGGAGTKASDMVEGLAVYVVNGGNDFEREARMRTAVGVLHGSASSEEERKVLAARLDESVATKNTALPSGGDMGVGRVARMAYDKLAEFWNNKGG